LKTNHLANPGENFFQSSHPDADLPTVCTSSGLLVIFFGRKKCSIELKTFFKIYFAQLHTTTTRMKLQRTALQCLRSCIPGEMRTHDLLFLWRRR
jgi:hypothetical protein